MWTAVQNAHGVGCEECLRKGQQALSHQRQAMEVDVVRGGLVATRRRPARGCSNGCRRRRKPPPLRSCSDPGFPRVPEARRSRRLPVNSAALAVAKASVHAKASGNGLQSRGHFSTLGRLSSNSLAPPGRLRSPSLVQAHQVLRDSFDFTVRQVGHCLAHHTAVLFVRCPVAFAIRLELRHNVVDVLTGQARKAGRCVAAAVRGMARGARRHLLMQQPAAIDALAKPGSSGGAARTSAV